jgi:hypothetical protein
MRIITSQHQQQYQQPFPHLQRRCARLSPEPTHSHSGGSVVAASADEIRAFGTPSMISPGASQCRLTTVATVGIRVRCMYALAVAIQVTEELACCPPSPLSHSVVCIVSRAATCICGRLRG